MPLRAAELEVLVTVNDQDVAKAEKNIKATGERIEKKPLKVDADAKGALASLDRVEAEAKKIVSKPTAIQVNARIESAEKSFKRVYERLEYLRSVEADVDVKADVARAEANLQKIQRSLDGLRNARAKMVVDVDDDPARQKLQSVEDYAGEAGADAGDEMGDSLVNALTAIPIAGAVLGIGVIAGKALLDGFNQGLQVEVRYDRLQALAGLDETDARRLGLAAGEAYANVFGESIEANMDTARLALQFDILDEDATTRDAKKIIEKLAGISDVLEEEVRPSAAAVATMLRTGIAKSADEAFDILATGAREGANRAEDLLDTFTEYPALFKRLGLSGPEALGLITQGLRAGARNSDLAADALKEFQIRATDASKASAEGFRLLGLDAAEMTSQIARGGAEARDGLDEVLRKLRETEDPVTRNAAAVALFGTQAEDLGEALFAMDLSSAVEQLDGVTGSAQRMFDTLADNDATKVQQAQRNIEVAVQGIQGALAGAFSEPLGDFADWVSQNRGPLLQFFQDLVNGAIDFGIGATDAVGTFVSGPLAEMTEGLAISLKWLTFGQADTSELDALADSMRGFDDTTDAAVSKLEEMRGEFNSFADAQVALGFLNDAALRTVDAISLVGSEHGTMEAQVRAAVDALREELTAADAAGESQANLTDRYTTATQAIEDQLVARGYEREEARKLIETYGAIPDMVTTVVTADTEPAQESVEDFVRRNAGRRFNMYIDALNAGGGGGGRGPLYNARGNLVEFFGAGGIRGMTPMQPIAQVVPPNTYRVVGDRGDVPESYIPWDYSPRSQAILLETMRAYGLTPMADGGIVSQDGIRRGAMAQFGDIIVRADGLSRDEAASLIRQAIREELQQFRG